MSNDNQRQRGKLMEELACNHLEHNGCEIIARNQFLGRIGEIDIVAFDKKQREIVFCEVRSRQSHYLHDSQLLSHAKQKRLRLLARVWLRKNGFREYHTRWRIDLFTITTKKRSLKWYKWILFPFK